MPDVERCGDHNEPLPCAACDDQAFLDDVWLALSLAMSLVLLFWVGAAALMTRLR
jgi:hypothetical protein